MLKKELGVFTWKDLIEFYPIKYIDRSNFFKISELHPDVQNIQIQGKVVNISEVGSGKSKRLVVKLRDDTGVIDLVWFKGVKFIKSSVKPGADYVVFGKPTLFQNRFNISHPEIITLIEFRTKGQKGLQAIYSSTEKLKARYLDSKGLRKLMENLFVEVTGKIKETIPDYLLTEYKFMSRERALLEIHRPDNYEIIKKAQGRLKFDELFYIQLRIIKTKIGNKKKYRGRVFSEVGKKFNKLYNEILPFDLTGAQKRVLKEIRKDVASGLHMNRLVQGDVGSGKTLVALMTMLLANDNGFQAFLMAPT